MAKNKISSKQNKVCKFSRGTSCLGSLVAALTITSTFGSTENCVSIPAETSITANVDVWEIYKGPIAIAQNRGILDYPAPMQVRNWMGVVANGYTALAMNDVRPDAGARDFFGKLHPDWRRCKPLTTSQEKDLLDAGIETFAYAYLWSIQHFVPEWAMAASTYGTSIGVDLNLCPRGTSNFNDCAIDTSVGLARHIFEYISNIFSKDGWNAEGWMTQVYNPIELEDFRREPDRPNFKQLCITDWRVMKDRCQLVGSNDADENVCWEPQSYQIGNFIYDETYKMPHVAESGRSYFLGDQDICRREIDYPCYSNMVEEANAVIRRVREMDDRQRARAEIYDNVWYWFNAFVTAKYDRENDVVGSNQFDFFMLKEIAASLASMYEATLVVWKEKIRIGYARPRDFIRTTKQNEVVLAWLGPEVGDVGQTRADNWVPYTMDDATASYPPYKGCMCVVFKQAMEIFTESDAIGATITIERKQFQSDVQPGQEPDNDLFFSYDQWSEFYNDCLAARETSGNHFSGVQAAADEICSGIAEKVLDTFELHSAGNDPTYMIDTENLPLQTLRCPPFYPTGLLDLLPPFISGPLEALLFWFLPDFDPNNFLPSCTGLKNIASYTISIFKKFMPIG